MIIMDSGVLSWLERRVSNCKVPGSMPLLGIHANYLAYAFCDVED